MTGKVKQLRELLGISNDQERVSELSDRLDQPHQRTRDVAEVLPDALNEAHRQGRLGPSLAKPLEQAIHSSIARDPKSFADMLFPVMGPAIRKSIGEAIKSLMEGINQAVQQSPLSPQGIRWRIEASRSGLPLSEVILRHTMAYRVRQAFLIQRDSGLLIAHASDEDEAALDEDAVSAMLTAIQDFVRDSVGDEQSGLSAAELGEHTVWALPGPIGQLAVIVDGHPPTVLRQELRERLEQMHAAFYRWMDQFDGQPPPADLQLLVDDCLLSARKNALVEKTGARRLSPALIMSALLVLGLIGWWGWSAWQRYQQQQAIQHLAEQFAATPGLVWIGVDNEGDQLLVRGLRDPLAAAPDSLSGVSALNPSPQFVMSSYQSLEPEVVARRLGVVLNPPAAVEISASNGAVRVAGPATQEWTQRLRNVILNYPAVPFDLSGLVSADQTGQWFEALQQRLAAPATLNLQLRDGTVLASGSAPLQWLSAAPAAAAESPLTLDLSAAVSDESLRYDQLVKQIERRRFLFADGTEMAIGTSLEIAAVATEIQQLRELKDQLGRSVEISIEGFTDLSGTNRYNEQLRQQRADIIRQALIDAGSEVTLIAVVGQGEPDDEEPNLQWRRAQLTVDTSN